MKAQHASDLPPDVRLRAFPCNTGLCGGSDWESCTDYANTDRGLFLELALVTQMCSICEDSARCTFIISEFVFSLNEKFI